MTYTPQPKDMTKFLVGITSQDALHTWEYADQTQRAVVGASAGAGVSIAQRKLREQRRKTVGAYNTSQLANAATSQRGSISQFSQSERTKITKRMEKYSSEDIPLNARKPSISERTPLSARPIPDATLYQRRPF